MSNYSFKELIENIKKQKSNILISLVIIALAFLSFGLGHLSAQKGDRTPIIIEKNSK